MPMLKWARNDFDDYLVAGAPGKRERACGWATAIGLQDVDGLKPSAYLIETAKRHIEGEISQVEEFFKVLVFGQDIELRNRFLRIGHEYGTMAAKAMENLHHHNVGIRRRQSRQVFCLCLR